MCYFRVVVDISECQSSDPGLFSRREGYDLRVGGGGGDEIECLILLFSLFGVM